MKVLLEQDIRGTGKKGDIIEVAEGFARNYLLPRKMATPADKAAINASNIQKSAAQHRKFQAGIQAREEAKRLENTAVTVGARVGPGGKLFGTISGKEVAAALASQKGITLDKKKIQIDPVHALGEYRAKASLFEGISVTFTVLVKPMES